MSFEIFFRKYIDGIRSQAFAKYEKDFSEIIVSELSKGYLKKLYEQKLVQILESVTNALRNLAIRDDKHLFDLTTSSVFIHGRKSQVKFDYFGKGVQGELGDLIFIISIIFNGEKYFEKLTITQFKKDIKRITGILWNINLNPA